MRAIPLHHNPYAIFRGSRTPQGLYARQKWLGEEFSSRWQDDFRLTVSELKTNQTDNRMHLDATLELIHRLFGLHLTVRQIDPEIQSSLDNLLMKTEESFNEVDEIVLQPEHLVNLPFAPSRWESLFFPATLFMATIFHLHDDARVTQLYDKLITSLSQTHAPWQEITGIHNLFRAMVVHPVNSKSEMTLKLVDWYASRQTNRGDWGPNIPFYQALNALAHLDLSEADEQLDRAFARLAKEQHPDGTWGDSEKEWNGFLAVHALRRKGIL
jgi:hypothetical protein